MHAACLVAEYANRDTMKIGLEVLRKSDFHPDAISVAWRGHTEALRKVERHEETDELGVGGSMAIGAIVASIVGIPIGISSIMGPVMVAGPLAALATGSAAGGVFAESEHLTHRKYTSSDGDDTRGVFAMANHFPINAHSAAHYEDRINDGAILVIVTSTPPRLDEAQAVLKTTGPDSLQRFAFHHVDALADGSTPN
ncbi:hypothetical protein [Planctomycetes bacterium TBK1r]|uniref:DUF1269 domain-containing protein n=1 Tax=Stieleria magnilauensis TaxID=2527963 RepID=A0ABX5XV74_9BACT|nr:hypothetical protein TBK1r_48650 [Planctomycetes bacterium TBK1r]